MCLLAAFLTYFASVCQNKSTPQSDSSDSVTASNARCVVIVHATYATAL